MSKWIQDTLVVMIFYLFLAFQITRSALIASSKVQSCLNSGVSSMDCQNKLVITLSVENDQAGDVESMETVIEAVDSDSGQQKLIYPVKITLEKTKVTARYPLRYRQDFNNRAKELVIFTSVFDCEDGARSNNPTCG